MNEVNVDNRAFSNPRTTRRRAVCVSPQTLVETRLLRDDSLLPLVIEPTVEGLDLIAWAQNNRPLIETHLLKHGGVLFRNFNVGSVEEFERFVRTSCATELLDYSYGSTPRHLISGKIYTSTEYPANQSIPLHNELSYSRHWPMKICFGCFQVAETGGETPIADSRRVLLRIPSEIRERFAAKGVMYIRNYSEQIDLPWQTVFQTREPSEVEAFCQRAGIEYEWKQGNRLQTRQTCQTIARHPLTNEQVWFNQAHLFHISNVDQAIRETLLAGCAEEDLPRNTYFGTGEPIPVSDLDEIREVYRQESILFSWQQGDILLLDNMLAAHGRSPFTGARRIVVGMSE